jgi:hypothetical protein
MKILTLLLVLLIAVPPVQAGGCAMDHGPDSADSAMAGHDCCPERQADPAPADSACDGPSHCGACVAGFAVISAPGQGDVQWFGALAVTIRAAELSPSHDLPPFRPPIS